MKYLKAFKSGLDAFRTAFIGKLSDQAIITLRFEGGDYPEGDSDFRDAMDMMNLLLNIYGKSERQADIIRRQIIEARIACEVGEGLSPKWSNKGNPPTNTILLCLIRDKCYSEGKSRQKSSLKPCLAVYVRRYSIEADPDAMEFPEYTCQYDEEADIHYIREGWHGYDPLCAPPLTYMELDEVVYYSQLKINSDHEYQTRLL